MNAATAYKDPDRLFTLRVPTYKGQGHVTIHAFDAHENSPGCHFASAARVDVEVWFDGACVFKRGDTWCRTSVMSPCALDSDEMKEHVLSLVAMKPGDTDDEYFANYTPDQLDFAESWGEEIGMYRSDRFCCPECGSFGKTHCSARKASRAG